MDHLIGYRQLAAAVLVEVVRQSRRRGPQPTRRWLRSDRGALWLAWLQLDPGGIDAALERRGVYPKPKKATRSLRPARRDFHGVGDKFLQMVDGGFSAAEIAAALPSVDEQFLRDQLALSRGQAATLAEGPP